MKKIIITIITIILLAFFSVSAIAQTENTDTGAKILAAMTITESADMHFGTMTVPSTFAEVDLAVGGTVSIANGTLNLLAQAPTSHAAAYNITGDANATYRITLPTNGSVSLTDGFSQIQVKDFVCSYGGLITTLDGTGNSSFTVGATIQLGMSQPAGIYSGTFDVSVSYY